VARAVLTRRNQEQLAVLHPLQLALHQAGLGRVAFIVGRVDRQQRGCDAFELEVVGDGL